MATWAEAVLVVPATANILAKMAYGLADDLASTTLLAVPKGTPVIVAPAMNTNMWLADATQQNVATIARRGVELVLPVEGHLACNVVGTGKLASVERIVECTLRALRNRSCQSLSGRHVLVTAGPTHEAIDPVRYLANASSGKMGYAIAREAALRGARVTLVSGPVSLDEPSGVQRVSVVSASQMHDAVMEAFPQCDVAICAAAVADYTPANPADHKLKKASERMDCIRLVETTDILAGLGATKADGDRRRIVVGFAAETNDLVAHAKDKLARKGCDLVVANDVSRHDSGFGTDTNRVTLIDPNNVDELPTLSKAEVAERILDRVEELLAEVEGGTR
jgi:phosphopantothenoylcysteine decarboxylase/phosphopantothenate--cysteine ligase